MPETTTNAMGEKGTGPKPVAAQDCIAHCKSHCYSHRITKRKPIVKAA